MFYRSDNRSPDQLRPVVLTPDFISTAEGSVLIEVGNTRVICTASIEETVPQFMRNTGRGWISSEYSMLPRSTLTRTPREASKGRQSGRTHEIQRLIGRSLRAVTDLARLGERTIWIDCDVIQADGGTRTASITGAFVALGLALEKLVDAGTLPSVPLKDFVAAVSVGIVDGEILLDLCYEEDSRADVDMNFVMTAGRKFVEVQATAEHQVFDEPQLAKMIAYARQGVQSLIAKQQAVLQALTLRLNRRATVTSLTPTCTRGNVALDTTALILRRTGKCAGREVSMRTLRAVRIVLFGMVFLTSAVSQMAFIRPCTR